MTSVRLSLAVRPELAGLIESIDLSPETTPGSHQVLPGPFPVFGFQLSGRMKVASGNEWRPLSRAGLTGLCTQPRTYNQTVSTQTVLVRLAPWAVPVLFGESAHQFTDRNESLQDIAPAFFRSICSGSTDAHRSVETFQELLIRNLRHSRRAPNVIAVEGARLIIQSNGKLRMRGLAEALGWSGRHVERVFLNEIGITPKEFAGIVRFRRAEKALRAGRSLVDVAFEAGYYDQSHLANDIKRFAGTVPSVLR